MIPDYPPTLPNMECFDPQRQSDLTLLGSYYSDVFSYIKIGFVPCDPKTAFKCKSEAEIYEWSKNNVFQLFFQDDYIDVHDYAEIVKHGKN